MEPKVRDAMVENRFTLNEGRSLTAALDEMKGLGVRAMAVVGPDGFKGLLVWRDAEEALHRESDGGLTAGDVCRSVVSIGLDDSLQAARALLDAEQVGLLPVVEGSDPVGVISRSLIGSFLEEERKRAAMEELRPPDDLVLRYEGSADRFFDSGRRGVATLRHLGLEPHHHVLDPGCGAGRMAIALTQYLTPDGGYEGFDVFRDCIEWCGEAITPRYPNFGFTYADVFVTLHNEAGQMQAGDYRFPYDDERFDFVVLISVFTHMLPDGFEQYLSEIARVLKTGGRVWATFFMLLNDATVELIDAARSPGQPVHDFGHYRLASTKLPEDAVAYREEHVREIFGRLGFEISTITRGNWASCDHPAMGAQDGVFAVKVDHPQARPAVQSAPPGA